jgi:DNA-binding NarL/FixJ family response regulator
MSGPRTVVIGEDDALLREGIVRLLGEGGFDVVAQAADADDLCRKGLAHRPELVIADRRACRRPGLHLRARAG